MVFFQLQFYVDDWGDGCGLVFFNNWDDGWGLIFVLKFDWDEGWGLVFVVKIENLIFVVNVQKSGLCVIIKFGLGIGSYGFFLVVLSGWYDVLGLLILRGNWGIIVDLFYDLKVNQLRCYIVFYFCQKFVFVGIQFGQFGLIGVVLILRQNLLIV